MRKQLLNYVVLRRSITTNRPVYGPENVQTGDHRLDAFMLALAGLSLEFGAYSASSLPVSEPTQLTKEQLGFGVSKNQDPRSAREVYERLGQSAFSGVLNVLQVTRGSTTENEGHHRGFKGQERRRGDLRKKEEGGIFEELWNRSYEPNAQGRDVDAAGFPTEPKVVSRRGARRVPRRITPRRRR